MQRTERHAQFLPIGDRVFSPEPLGHRRQIRFGLLARDARLQPRQRAQEIHRRAHPPPRIRIRSQRNRQLGFPDRKEELRRQDTHDGVARAIECQRRSHHLRIGAETPLPEAMTHDHDPLLPRRVIRGQQCASDGGLHAQHLEGIGGDPHSLQSLGVAAFRERDAPVREGGDPGQSLILVPIVDEIRKVERAFDGIRTARRDPHQLLRLPERKLPEQDAVHQAENRRIAADAKRERQDRDRCDARLLEHRADAMTQVLPEVHEESVLRRTQNDRLVSDLVLHSPQFPRQQFTVAQLGERRATGFRLGRVTGAQLGVTVLQMLRQLLDDLGLARGRKIQARQPPSDLLFPLRHADPHALFRRTRFR